MPELAELKLTADYVNQASSGIVYTNVKRILNIKEQN